MAQCTALLLAGQAAGGYSAGHRLCDKPHLLVAGVARRVTSNALAFPGVTGTKVQSFNSSATATIDGALAMGLQAPPCSPGARRCIR